MEEEKFDGILLNITQQSQGINGLLTNFFSFLRRKTDFLSQPENAEEIIMKSFKQELEKFNEIERRKEEERVRKLEKEEKKRNEQEQKLKEQMKEKPVKDTQDQDRKEALIEEVTEEEAAELSTPVDKKEEMKDEDEEEPPELVEEGKEPSKEPEKEKEDDTPPPGNGGTCERYVWTQTLSELCLTIPVDESVVAKNVDINLTPDKIKVAIKGQPPIINGRFPIKIKSDETFWTIEEIKGGKMIQLNIEKLDTLRWWDCAIDGDPKIDTQKIVPENSKLADLDPETRGTVEKMMFDQRQSAAGLPTSSQIEKDDILKKFMKEHPEMDFSKTKVC